MIAIKDSNVISDLERRVIVKVYKHLIPRKSSQILHNIDGVPLTTTPEIRSFAADSLHVQGIDVHDYLMGNENLKLQQLDDTTRWSIFWALELAAAKAFIAGRSTYEQYLPGRFLHYDLTAYRISGLYGDNISGKKIAELGSGSGLGLIRLAQKGADVTGIDSAVMALEFSKYLRDHHRVPERKMKLVEGEYLDTKLPDNEFDVVYSSGVVEHLTDDKAKSLLEEKIRITKPGGYIVFTIPNDHSKFYQGFKDQESQTRARFPNIIDIPVEHTRYHIDPQRLMEERLSTDVRVDGVLIAPSAPIKPRDIDQEDLIAFDTHLPNGRQQLTIQDKVSHWSTFEALHTNASFRRKYGWSSYYAAKKPS